MYQPCDDLKVQNASLCEWGRVTKSKKKILVIMHERQTCPGYIGWWLTSHGYQLDIRKPRWGDTLPETLESYVGVIVYGGNMSANDNVDYIRKEIDWLSVPLEEKKPYIGICLGAQLLVKALGGDVFEHANQKVEAGYYSVTPTAKSVLDFEKLTWPQKVFEWHREGITCPSEMIPLLKGGGEFENQALSYRNHCFAFQFHPEVSERIIRRWINVIPELLTKPGARRKEVLVSEHLIYRHSVQTWLGHFLKRWVG